MRLNTVRNSYAASRSPVGTDDGGPAGTVTTLYIHGRNTDGLPSGWSYWLNKVRPGTNPTLKPAVAIAARLPGQESLNLAASMGARSHDASTAARALEQHQAWAEYLPSSRPAKEEPSAFGPHVRIPVTSPLDPSHRGDVSITRVQDRVYITPGEAAVVAMVALRQGTRQPLNIEQVELLQLERASGDVHRLNAAVVFKDDCLAPDEAANDNQWTAAFVAPDAELRDFKGDLRLRVLSRIGTEGGAVTARARSAKSRRCKD